ncbi:MAG: hypothetical protein V4643_10780 [Bacteroidota bacterium]
MKRKIMRWVAWFENPICFATKEECYDFCKGKIVMISKISKN